MILPAMGVGVCGEQSDFSSLRRTGSTRCRAQYSGNARQREDRAFHVPKRVVPYSALRGTVCTTIHTESPTRPLVLYYLGPKSPTLVPSELGNM